MSLPLTLLIPLPISVNKIPNGVAVAIVVEADLPPILDVVQLPLPLLTWTSNVIPVVDMVILLVNVHLVVLRPPPILLSLPAHLQAVLLHRIR